MSETDDLKQQVAELRDQFAAVGRAQPTPWFWKNPLANKTTQGSLLSTKTAVIQEAGFRTTDFTTTNVAALESVMNVTIRIPTGQMCIFAWATFGMKHSAAGASVDAYLGLDDGTGALYVMSSITGIYLATANKILPVTLSSGLNVPSNLSGLTTTTHQPILRLVLVNQTAGTLTVPGTGSDKPVLHGFVTGDSSK